MRVLTALILGAFAIAAPVRSATDSPPPNELEIEARIKAAQQQQQDLKAKEDQLRKELSEAKGRAFGGIKAEVSGILKYEKDHRGYFILTRAAKGDEVRVWLKPNEPQLLLQVTKLVDKEVTVTGPLHQNTKPAMILPELPAGTPPPAIPPVFDFTVGGVQPTQVPANGLYLEQFKIEESVRPVK